MVAIRFMVDLTLACGLDHESFKPSTITLVEGGSKFVPLPPEKGRVLLDMVKGQK